MAQMRAQFEAEAAKRGMTPPAISGLPAARGHEGSNKERNDPRTIPGLPATRNHEGSSEAQYHTSAVHPDDAGEGYG